jgi:hypothetical protein
LHFCVGSVSVSAGEILLWWGGNSILRLISIADSETRTRNLLIAVPRVTQAPVCHESGAPSFTSHSTLHGPRLLEYRSPDKNGSTPFSSWHAYCVVPTYFENISKYPIRSNFCRYFSKQKQNIAHTNSRKCIYSSSVVPTFAISDRTQPSLSLGVTGSSYIELPNGELEGHSVFLCCPAAQVNIWLFPIWKGFC